MRSAKQRHLLKGQPSRRLQIARQFGRLSFETLESRLCLSVFYDFDIMAQTNAGEIGSTIEPAVSINDAGQVAFVGASGAYRDIFAGETPGAVTGISGAVNSDVTYSRELQINNNGQVAAVAIMSGVPAIRSARIYDGDAVEPFTVIGSAITPRPIIGDWPYEIYDPLVYDFYDSIASATSISNDGQLAFAGLLSQVYSPRVFIPSYWFPNLSDSKVDAHEAFPSTQFTTIPTGTFFRFTAADGDRVVIGTREGTTETILLHDITGIATVEEIASTADGDWKALGIRPGISDDGNIVTFYGDLTSGGAESINSKQSDLSPLAPGPGIFASLPRSFLGGRVLIRVAGESGNDQLDPGEIFVDLNGNGVFDSDEQDQGPFSKFEIDVRPGVTNLPDNLDAVTVSYVAQSSADGNSKGLYTSQLTLILSNAFMPNEKSVYTVGNPSTVIEVGQTLPTEGIVRDIAVHDSINNTGQLAVWVSTDDGQAVLRANPHRTPVLFVPGIAGNWFNPETSTYMEWLMNRGIQPDKLLLDPLLHSYDDLIESLVQSGYKKYDPENPQAYADLFIANYDWRVDVAPKDSSFDGVIAGVTGTSISDNTFEFGIDYLGWWLKLADAAWQSRFHQPLKTVDVIAHSTGGLVTRSYIQSTAYGDGLPKIDNFVMAAVPNRGASKAWNPLHDNWIADPSYSMVLSKILAGAYNKVVDQEGTINGPTNATDITASKLPMTLDPVTNELRPDPLTFIQLYCPTIRSLLATYDFLNLGSGTYTNTNHDERFRNDIALDLNNGLDYVSQGDVRPFAQFVRAVAIFGVSEPTPTRITTLYEAPLGNPGVIAPMNGGVVYGNTRMAAPNETWYADIELDEGGDGTVPLESLDYAIDDRIEIYRFTKPNLLYSGVAHTEILANSVAQRQILNLLGARIDDEKISTGERDGTFFAALNSSKAVWTFWADPVEAYITDANGKRFGFATSTGVLEEIPGSIYFGGADGIGWIQEPVAGPLQLHLSGLGQDYAVRIEGSQGSAAIVFEKQGFLAAGATETYMIPMPNQPPVLAEIGTKSVDELATLSFTATATDPDLPANGITFSLLGEPEDALIDAATGDFTWTPTESQGPGRYTFTVRVTDNGSPILFDEESITVIRGIETNQPPVLDWIGTKSVNELATLSFTATATDPDLPANALTFRLIDAPVGASIAPATGDFVWIPTEAQGPGSYTFTVRVTDNGSPLLFDEEEIVVTVAEVNATPVLATIGDQSVNELATLSFAATATDPDLPANALTFSLIDAPVGASIAPATGDFVWVPTETQGPGSYTFTVRVTDNGSPTLFDEEEIVVSVAEVNAAPVLATIGDQWINELATLSFAAMATDPDLSTNALTFSLIGAPIGASIAPETGAFMWAPTEVQGPGSYTLTVRVTDNGSPILFDEEEIVVTVAEVAIVITRLGPPVENRLKLAVDFSVPMNAGTAEDVRNYTVGLEGQPPLHLISAQYEDTSQLHRTTLVLESEGRIEAGQYQVSVKGGKLLTSTGQAILPAANDLLIHVNDSNSIVRITQQPDASFGLTGDPLFFGYASPRTVLADDFTGHGRADLVVVTNAATVSQDAGRPVLLYAQQADGSYASPTQIPVGHNGQFATAYAVDWNRDGHQDLVLSGTSPSPHFVILLNDGHGHFVDAPDTPITLVAHSIPAIAAFGDFTGDGLIDVACGWASSPYFNPDDQGPLKILTKDPFLGYSLHSTLTNGQPGSNVTRIVTADFNEDGRLDLLTNLTGAWWLRLGTSLYLSNATGGFESARDIRVSELLGGSGLLAGDFNGDGHVDIVGVPDLYSNSSNIYDGNVVIVLQGDGRGNFTQQSYQRLNKRGLGLQDVADLNKDGNLDLVLISGPSVWTLLGDGQGNFTRTTQDPVALAGVDTSVPTSMSLRDVNGDGFPDAVFGSANLGQIRVMYNDGQGVLRDSGQAGPSTGSWAPYRSLGDQSFVVADVNRDGTDDMIKKTSKGTDIYLGTDDGHFRLIESLNATGSIQVADFNDDSTPDLLINTGGTPAVFLGQGDGHFTPGPTSPALPSTYYSVCSGTLADVNLDGKLDYVAYLTQIQGYSPTVVAFGVFFGDGTGRLLFNLNTVASVKDAGFLLPRPTYGNLARPNVGDFDFDGKPDLFFSSAAALTIYHGQGNGTFIPGIVTAKTRSTGTNLFLPGDFNGDGRLDLLGYGSYHSREVEVLWGDGAGHFNQDPDSYFQTPHNVANLAMGDFSGDGRLDVAVTYSDPSQIVAFWLGDGTGHFGPAQEVTVGPTPWSLRTVPGQTITQVGTFVVDASLVSSEIHGRIWHDADDDGVCDPTEPGLAGRTIYLDLNGSAQFDTGEPSVTTDDNGSYSFTGLKPVSYTVRPVLAVEWHSTTPSNGLRRVTLEVGLVLTDQNFGYRLSDENPVVAVNDGYAATEDMPLDVAGPGVLLNDLGLAGRELHAVMTTSTAHGILELLDDGSFAYTPDPGFNREDSFQYRASDGTDWSDPATVTITVETAYPWYNGSNRINVNGDKYISPQDALWILATLNDEGGRVLPLERPRPLAPPFYDVSRDGMVSPLDALLVISYLNNEGSGDAEGENAVAPETMAFMPLSQGASANALVNANDEGDAPPQTAPEKISLAPLTGFPLTEEAHEASLWGKRDTKWTDEDLEEILVELVGGKEHALPVT